MEEQNDQYESRRPRHAPKPIDQSQPEQRGSAPDLHNQEDNIAEETKERVGEVENQLEETLKPGQYESGRLSVIPQGSARVNKKSRKKEITLLGKPAEHFAAMLAQMDKQYDQVSQSILSQPQLQVDLSYVNKYVGYKSYQCEVTLETVNAKVLQLNFLGQFKQIATELTVDRINGMLTIHVEKNGNMNLDMSYQRPKIVKLPDIYGETANPEDYSTEKNESNSVSTKHNTRNNLSLRSFVFQQDWLKKQIHQVDFPKSCLFPFWVKCEQKSYMFYAKTREERDILAHEINSFCDTKDEKVQFLTARKDVMHLIDPIDSFNAYNLSMVCAPITQEQESFNRTGALEGQRGSIFGQEQIITAEPTYVEYIRDGIRCYVSPTLRRELYCTDGALYKLPQKQGNSAKYYKRFAIIDYKRQLFRFRNEYDGMRMHNDGFKLQSEVNFVDILEVKALALDVFRGEHKVTKELPFKSKFMVRTLEREHLLFALNDRERDIWLSSFAKILAYNGQGDNTIEFNLKVQPDIKNLGVEKLTAHGGSKKEVQAQTGGVQSYVSTDLVVTRQFIKGNVMKAIETRSFFNTAEYHQRFFKLEFGQIECHFFENDKKKKPHRTHKQTDLIQCKVLEMETIQENLDERNRKRSKSLLKRTFHDDAKECAWNFAFTLEFTDKQYELYAPTRKDRDQWTKALGAIAEMNRQGVMLETRTPFEYLEEQELAMQQILEEQKMTESARDRKTIIFEAEQEEDKVCMWLKLNQELMAKQNVNVPLYDSQYLRLRPYSVRGQCYVVGRVSANQANLYPQFKVGQIKFFMVEMYLNLKTQMLLVQKKELEGISKLLFSEIQSITPHTLAVDQIDYDTNQIDPNWKHCFSIQMVGKPAHMIVCQNLEDKNQWLRCFYLILKMKDLSIDFSNITIFTFEHFQKQQMREVQLQSEGQSSTSQLQSNNSMKRRRKQVIRRPQDIEKELSDQIGTLQTSTMVRSFRVIEGYLLKEIDTKSILQVKNRHLRYFRIIFSSGKLNIKEDKAKTQMRSLFLKDLKSVEYWSRGTTDEIVIRQKFCLGNDSHARANSIDKEQLLMTKHQIWKKYAVDEVSNEPNWPHTIKLDFHERSFTLHVRTKREGDEWYRVLNIYLRMSKAGLNPVDKNPYIFEDQERSIVNQTASSSAVDGIRDSAATIPKELGRQENPGRDQNINFVNEVNEVTGKKADEIRRATAGTAQGFHNQKHHNLDKIRQKNNASQQVASGSNMPISFGPVKAYEQLSSQQQQTQSQSVVNYNINVQNITIKQVRPKKRGSEAAQQQQNRAQDEQRSAMIISDMQAQRDNCNVTQDPIEIIASLNDEQSLAFTGTRPQSAMAGSRKKKKKVRRRKGESERDYANASVELQQRNPSDLNRSEIGGITEYDLDLSIQPSNKSFANQASSQTRVQRFCDEPLEDVDDQNSLYYNDSKPLRNAGIKLRSVYTRNQQSTSENEPKMFSRVDQKQVDDKESQDYSYYKKAHKTGGAVTISQEVQSHEQSPIEIDFLSKRSAASRQDLAQARTTIQHESTRLGEGLVSSIQKFDNKIAIYDQNENDNYFQQKSETDESNGPKPKSLSKKISKRKIRLVCSQENIRLNDRDDSAVISKESTNEVMLNNNVASVFQGIRERTGMDSISYPISKNVSNHIEFNQISLPTKPKHKKITRNNLATSQSISTSHNNEDNIIINQEQMNPAQQLFKARQVEAPQQQQMLWSFDGNNQEDDDDWDAPTKIVKQLPTSMNSQRQQQSPQNEKVVNEVTNTIDHQKQNDSVELNQLDDLEVISDW